jgi:hypothetical protein
LAGDVVGKWRIRGADLRGGLRREAVGIQRDWLDGIPTRLR